MSEETHNLYRYEKTNIVYPLVKNNEKDKKINAFRKEASRKAAMANKRLARLEKNGLTDSPAYKKYIAEGGRKFSVKGKSHNELQAEVARLDRFINAQSSTVKGATQLLKDLAKNTGIEYKNMQDLKSKAPKFFELSSKVEQYLRTVEDRASAVGYQKIWEAVNEYVKQENVDLSDANNDLDSMIENITKALNEFDTPLPDKVNGMNIHFNWYKVKE